MKESSSSCFDPPLIRSVGALDAALDVIIHEVHRSKEVDVRAPLLRAFGGERVWGWKDRRRSATLRPHAKLVCEVPTAESTVQPTVVHKPVVVVHLTQGHARACGVHDLGAEAGDGDLAGGHWEGGLLGIGEDDFPRGKRQRFRPVRTEWVGRWGGGGDECVCVEGRGARAGDWALGEGRTER